MGDDIFDEPIHHCNYVPIQVKTDWIPILTLACSCGNYKVIPARLVAEK